MPCECDYLEANDFERRMSQVACLLDEIRGHKNWKDGWDGYHPSVYNRTIGAALADHWVKSLCDYCQTHDVTKHSLELQMWWRDHQEADGRRIHRELQESLIKEEREVALSKLTPYERRLLKLED